MIRSAAGRALWPAALLGKGIMDAPLPPQLSAKELETLSGFITETCGIKMPLSKKSLLESRLQKRLRALGLDSFSQYCEYLFSDLGRRNELRHCLDAVTTNKTDFFREPSHFTFLIRTVVPALSKLYPHPPIHLNLWSAGCSTGEEPYTLAMVLSEQAQSVPGLDFAILGTDLSTRVLKHARLGIYTRENIAPIPESLRQRYFLQSKNHKKDIVRVVPELRNKIEFRQLNFMESFQLPNKFHVIFCRNVLIYFDRSRQEALLSKFCNHLSPGGFLFLGHSESINAMHLPLNSVATTVYQLQS